MEAGDAKACRQREEIYGRRGCRIGERGGTQDGDLKAADDVQSRPLMVLRRFLG